MDFLTVMGLSGYNRLDQTNILCKQKGLITMKKTFIKEIAPYIELHRDKKTGIAWIENGKTGNGHSCHPNIDSSGSVVGMKKLGYWNKEDRTVRCKGYIYNIDKCVVTDEYDKIAMEYCRCGGKHNR